MTTYRGFNVLEIEPDWSDARPAGYTRAAIRLDQGFGKVQVTDHGARNVGSMGFAWWAGTRVDIQTLRAFFDAQRGALTPFWVPTWMRDFTLASARLSSDSALVTNWRGYTANLFADLSRRDLAIMATSGNIYRRITSASATTTETLTLDSTLGAAVPAASPVCFLLLCRFASDEIEIDWETSDFATCQITLQEVPLEVP